MKTFLPRLAAFALCVTAHAASFQTYEPASSVLGQPDFTTGTSVSGLPNRFSTPYGVACDPTTGKVFVADSANNRILRFSNAAAMQNGANPEAVFGQPNFTAADINQGNASPTARTLWFPTEICVDSQGRLWVADFGNNRVLGYYLASLLGSEPAADIVLGQADFTSNASMTAINRMDSPIGVSVGPDDTLWVTDSDNARVLGFDTVSGKASGADADHVLGQANFNTNTSATTATGLNFPASIFADAAGRLWVGDVSNRRVVRYDDVAMKANGAAADAVVGQDDFTSAVVGATATRFLTPYGVYFDGTNLWVGDYGGNRVLRFPNAASIAAGGTADLVLGKPDFTTTTSTLTQKEIRGPIQVAAGPSDSLLVVNYDYSRVLRFDPVPNDPAVTISGKKKVVTSKSKYTLKGTATGDDLARMEVRVGKGNFVSAKGTSTWRLKVPLATGKNAIQVRAVNVDGDLSKTVRIKIIRK